MLNFICIGVQKGGTKSLIEYMNLHPEIHMEGEKHFFDRPLSYGQLTKEDIKNYESTFKTNKLIIGEKTPSYCFLRYALDRIYNYNKNIKLILILREPISRAYSQFEMYKRIEKKTNVDASDEEILDAIKKEENIKLHKMQCNSRYYLQRGFYDEILEYILAKFPKDNIYIGISEEINNNKLKYYNKIYEFLGTFKLKYIDDNLNKGVHKYKPIPHKVEQYLYSIYKPHNDKLYKILGRKIDIWENYYNQLKSQS